MKYLLSFVAVIMLVSCNDDFDDYLTTPLKSKADHSIIDEHFDDAITEALQRPETDFNFVLRAHFPPQSVEITRSSGRVDIIRFQGNMKVWRNGRVDGKIRLGHPKNAQIYSLVSTPTGVRCDGVTRKLDIEATLTSRKSRSSPISVLLTVSSEDGDDNPDCVIWDIMDGGGDDGGMLTSEGSIQYIGPC